MPDGRYPTAVEEWLRNQQSTQADARPSPSPDGFVGARYFVTEAMLAGRPRSTVIPAGESQFGQVEDPFPDRQSFEQRMAERNAIAAEVEKINRMNGSSTISNPRQAIRDQYTAHLVRSRDGAGRIFTEYERIVPGADIF